MTSRRRAHPAVLLFGGGRGRGFESRLGRLRDRKSRVRVPFGALRPGTCPVPPRLAPRPGSGGARPREGSVQVPVPPVGRCGCSGAGGRQGGTELRRSGAAPGGAAAHGGPGAAGAEKSEFIDTRNEILPRRAKLWLAAGRGPVLHVRGDLIRKSTLIGEGWGARVQQQQSQKRISESLRLKNPSKISEHRAHH